jgi:hypothetical protein
MNPIARSTSAGLAAAAGAALLAASALIAGPSVAAPSVAEQSSRVAPDPGVAGRPGSDATTTCGAGRFAVACTAPPTGTRVGVPAAAVRALDSELARRLPAGASPPAAFPVPTGAERALADDLARSAAESVRVPPAAARALAADLSR